MIEDITKPFHQSITSKAAEARSIYTNIFLHSSEEYIIAAAAGLLCAALQQRKVCILQQSLSCPLAVPAPTSSTVAPTAAHNGDLARPAIAIVLQWP